MLAKPVALATDDPRLGPDPVEAAYAAATRLEAADDPRCVDSYFQAAAASWPLVRSSLGCVDPASLRAWRLYHSSVAKLIRTGQRFGRLDPTRGLSVAGPWGHRCIPIRCHGFLWRPSDFNELNLVGSYTDDEILTKYRSNGIGIPLVVKRQRCFDEPLRKRIQLFPATAVMRTMPGDSAGQTFALDLYDPVRVQCINLGGAPAPIHRDLSAPFAFRLTIKQPSDLEAFRSPGSTANATGLYALEPYQPGKIPVIFVHGLLSDPTTWIAMVNELRARPDILERYQIWAFEYPTGGPFVGSARVLREELAEAIALLDPHGQDPALSNMVMVGHSMGGLVAKLQITSSETILWRSIANRPFDQIVGSDTVLTSLAGAMFFQPQPAIKRMVFIATPHRGAGTAQRVVGRITSSLVQESPERKAEHRRLIECNPGAFSPEFQKRIPTSIDMLEPDSCILQATDRLPIAPYVAMHSIIGDKYDVLGKLTDGIVPVSSALLRGVESQCFVCAKHTKIQSRPETINEVLRILRMHAACPQVGASNPVSAAP